MHESRSVLPLALASALADRYRVDRELGAGGMSTVYLAEDLRHHRRVAVKVLHPELAAVIGSERFLAEIRTVANLQHPHILGLIDSGEVEGIPFYVMPFVEGESLRDRLTRERQLPVEEALRLAREIAAALDYAHRHGVIHRDIKPENILLQDGNALVADFGIALAVSSAGGQRLTQTGLSLGTPAYMSPEQAMGERTIDARSDVYALGAVTYEMLAGTPPFTGPSAQAIVSKVLTEAVRPLRESRHTVPLAAERAILRALEKLPADRYASAAQFAEMLGRSSTGDEEVAYAPSRTALQRTLRSPWTGWAAAASLALTAILLGVRTPPARDFPPSRLAIVAPGLGGSGGTSLQRQLTLSPEGDAVLFVSTEEGYNRLMRQGLDEPAPARVAGVRLGFASPVFSRDGRWLIGTVWGERSAFRYSAAGTGGEALALTRGFTSWIDTDARGTMWYSPGGRGLARIGPGDSLAISFPDSVADLRLQQILPGDRHALMTRLAGGQLSGPLLAVDLRTGAQTPLLGTPVVEARYTSGFLVYALTDGRLQASAFDARALRLSSGTVTIASGIALTGTGVAQFAVASNGTVAYIPEEPRSLVLVDRQGRSSSLLNLPRGFHAPQFSPDGSRLSLDFTSADGRDVWILTVSDGTLSRATFVQDAHDATWTPDGRHITFFSYRSGTGGIYRKRPDGSAQADSLYADQALAYTGNWLRDQSALVTTATDLGNGTGSDIAIVRNHGRGPVEPLVATQFTEAFPRLSPDERWLAFVSDQSGRPEVYVQPFGADGEQVQVSLSGGTEPVWSRDGSELFFRSVGDGDPQLISASIASFPRFAVTSRRPLFDVREMVGSNPHANYDVSPDGSAFVMVRRSPSTRIMVIQNLPALVQRLRDTR